MNNPVSYFVFYRGRAKDEEAFITRYREKHIPILRSFPGIIDVKLFTPLQWKDQQSVSPGNFLIIVEMVFNSSDALKTALNSEQRRKAREDFKQFPPFEGDIWHQAMSIV